jgi:hypothetical protein
LTRKSALASDESKILEAYSGRQAAFYEALIAKSPKDAKFCKAWMKRAAWLPKKTGVGNVATD